MRSCFSLGQLSHRHFTRSFLGSFLPCNLACNCCGLSALRSGSVAQLGSSVDLLCWFCGRQFKQQIRVLLVVISVSRIIIFFFITAILVRSGLQQWRERLIAFTFIATFLGIGRLKWNYHVIISWDHQVIEINSGTWHPGLAAIRSVAL